MKNKYLGKISPDKKQPSKDMKHLCDKMKGTALFKNSDKENAKMKLFNTPEYYKRRYIELSKI